MKISLFKKFLIITILCCIFMSCLFLIKNNDTEEYVQAFTWENSSGVPDRSCTPLENISDDI